MRFFIYLALNIGACLSLGACSADQGEALPPIAPMEKSASPSAPSAPPAVTTAPPPEPQVEIAPNPCADDSECAPGFCDRGICAARGKANYGRECNYPLFPEPRPPPPPQKPGHIWWDWGPPQICHGYRCIDKRCRSCISDAECGASDMVCQIDEGFPGKRCGAPPKPDSAAPPASPPPMPSTLPGMSGSTSAMPSPPLPP